MRKSILASCFCVGVVLVAWPASAAPIVDGIIDAANYYPPLPDTMPADETGEDYYNTGLDIDNLYFDDDPGSSVWYSLGVEVVNPDIDPDGDPTSILDETWFGITFLDSQGGTALHSLLARMRLVGGTPTVLEVILDGSILAAADYDADVDEALEVSVKQSAMPNMVATPYVEAQLDGTGNWRDDQMEGYVPEPATLGLLGAGAAIAVLVRRRR